MQGHVQQAMQIMTPYLKAGPNGGNFTFGKGQDSLTAGKEGGSLVRLVPKILRNNAEAIKGNHPQQCTFLGTRGGTPGMANFFPYCDLSDRKVVTTERPQITITLEKNQTPFKIDNCHYWHTLLSTLREEVTTWEQDASVQDQVHCDDGYSSEDDIAHYRYKELKFVRKLA